MKPIQELIINTNENRFIETEDVYLKDGLPYCKKCNEPRFYKRNGDDNQIVNAICSCEVKRQEQEEKNRLTQERLFQIARLKKASRLGKIYENARFEDLDPNRDNDLMSIVDRAKKYVENFAEIKEIGQGFYLFGDTGTGKSYLTACIGNALLKKGVPVLFTSFSDIVKMIKETFNYDSSKTETDVIEVLTDVDLLIIDDLGTEKITDNNFMQEKIYDVINSRYLTKKPTIYSSNFSLNELIKRGLNERIIDRIFEMSGAIFQVKGQSYRLKKQREPLF